MSQIGERHPIAHETSFSNDDLQHHVKDLNILHFDRLPILPLTAVVAQDLLHFIRYLIQPTRRLPLG